MTTVGWENKNSCWGRQILSGKRIGWVLNGKKSGTMTNGEKAAS
jgi:hypothetical protein